MNKFHSIATDSYVPISFDNAYLFNQYDRISNFLIFNLDKKYKNVLAKPVKNNYDIDWYSIYVGIQAIEVSPYRDYGLRQYWFLYEEIQKKIEDLLRNRDPNVQHWGAILKTVFRPEDNLIFTNGKDICIVWGWKFNNNQNQKPYLLSDSAHSALLPPLISSSVQPLETLKEALEYPKVLDSKQENKEVYDDYPILNFEADNIDLSHDKKDTFSVNKISKERGFLKFMKYIAIKYWWILVILLVLICMVFFFKSLKF